MTALEELLHTYREAAQSEREKGTYFEELIRTYFRYEATYADYYSDVWLYSDWAEEQGIDKRDTGIDLVAKTRGTNEYHAIQCKFYAEDYKVQKKDIDSFFTASGQKPFTHRIIITTTNNWSEHAEDSLINQQPPVNKIDLHDLENSQIDWAKYQADKAPVLKEKKTLFPHQKIALNNVVHGLETADRGKLLMACGTGKTFTSLKIAEELAGKGKRILFLVPSLSLLSQTLTEWTQESSTPLHSFAVCSDSEVGKKRKKDDDSVQTFAHELRYPATTEAKRLSEEMTKRHDEQHMSVVFSTYHSINVISEAQHKYKLADFDLIICDEAHRTTGATFGDESESNFVKVHNADFIHAAKRIYMTATPRIYADLAKVSADKDNVTLCSMDDESLYGKVLYLITFSEAVSRGLLVDYKVIVLTVDEGHISSRLQSLLKDENNQLRVDDAAKIIGCWKALSKQDHDEGLSDDSEPMRRAVAFCQVIEEKLGAKTNKVSSKNIANMFQAVVDAYQEQEEDHNTLHCEAEHVDGSMNASQKEEKLDWLKAEPPEDTCRILSNVRCLSEGVDVPALDAVLFLTPRNSQVDVVQSVGRVMRNAPNKRRGYVILPVVIPTGMEPHEALNHNKVYKVVWEVLQALRSHDDRFDAMINKLDLIGKDNSKMEVIAVTNKVNKKTKKTKGTKNKDAGRGQSTIGTPEKPRGKEAQTELQFEVGEIERALYAKVVKKCGNRNHWEDWANDIAKIANTHITRITTIVSEPNNKKEVAAFNAFADELRDDLNDSITDAEVIEMLAQHLITKPVFDALFKDYSFASNNPVSQAMQQVLDILQEHRLDKEANTLEKFYASVQMRAEGIDNAEGKQKIVVELYDKFFRNAFPKMTERLGIVYTPVEVVDFIINSTNDLLKNDFDQSLGSRGVHIIDPFTGTGTFITRLLQSGIITKEQLPHKYKNEIHANEIILLAYYISAINIEAVYHSLIGGKYQPFEGICLSDTFQLYEKDDLVSELLANNSDRRTRQKNLDIRVIIGNPPYSGGQKSENDNNANYKYPILDEKIRQKYAQASKATLKNSLYDSYIRAIRWGSDRLGESGILAYVTGGAWVERSFADGMRKCLAEEFSDIYILNLRGDIRKNMLSKGKAREGENIFGASSMTGIVITFLVKKPLSSEKGNIYYFDIGDDLKCNEKLKKLQDLGSIEQIIKDDLWTRIQPDHHNDWLNQRDDSFSKFIEIGNRDKNNEALFNVLSNGINTSRDSWCINYSKKELLKNMKTTINHFNGEVSRLKSSKVIINKNNIDGFLDADAEKISWSDKLKRLVINKKTKKINTKSLVRVLYRPFSKSWLYLDKDFIDRVGQMDSLFIQGNPNKAIMVSGIGSRSGFSTLMIDEISTYDTLEKGRCFPLKIYGATENSNTDTKNLFFSDNQQGTMNTYICKDGISDAGFEYFKKFYPNENFTREDIFYYIYGLLHSLDYRERYIDNLIKELPHIPCVKRAKDFWRFSKAGNILSNLHVNFETADCYPVKLDIVTKRLKGEDYFVTKMKFANKNDKSVVIYNHNITVREIPLVAYDYIINGKPAIQWVMERQALTIDKKSGIKNNANLWATETMEDAKYPLELLQRVITVSLETMKIVNALPKLDID